MSTTKVQGDMIDVDAATVAVVAAGDKFNFLDITDSLVKEDTIQGVLDLAGGPTLASSQATSSGTTITFGSIPAGTKRIFVMVEGGSHASGNSTWGVRLGDAGGIETSGYLAGVDWIGSESQATDRLTMASVVNIGGVDSALYTMGLLDAATFTWVGSGTFNDSTNGQIGFAQGSKSLSAELTQVQLICSNAFDAGKASISYD